MNQWIYRLSKWALTLWAKVAIPVYAIKGRYPEWALTPDDPVSPFGQGEPTMRWIYLKLGRYVGDVVWLGIRNAAYGYAYKYGKPDWLKNPALKYEDLLGKFDIQSTYPKTVYTLQQPDGSKLTETQRRYGLFILIIGHRIQPIIDGALENDARLRQGLERAPRPAKHPNMDGRSIISIRTKRTL